MTALHRNALLAVTVAGGLLMASQAALSFECPRHFDQAQTAIDKVAADMKGSGGGMQKADMALVHALLDDAKMTLAGARHNHEKPQGAYDHARSIAKADAALGGAKAADLLRLHYMKQ